MNTSDIIVWDVATNKLPDLRKKLQVLLEQDLETPDTDDL
jgi:uncharacterized protein with HEPN domain